MRMKRADGWLVGALRWCACLAGGLPLLTGAAQSSLSAIRINGPVANRFNVVFLSEGYTGAQAAQFRAVAANAFAALLEQEPFREYSNYFNGFAIFVASAESGSDHPASKIFKNTYFNSAYESGQLITIPPNRFDSSYANGQGRVDTLVQTHLSNRCHLAVLLVNDPAGGGSDGAERTAIASAGPGMGEFLAHESGHVVAGLGDEYADPYPGFPELEEPNTTRETNRAMIKWRAWIDSATPLPTPWSYDYLDSVGLFEGAHYHSTGWYRPMLDCRMRSMYVPFCAVCREALTLAFYRQLRPVDACSPTATNLTITSMQPLDLEVIPLRPGHELAIQWQTNGVVVPGSTNAIFTLSPAQLGNGTHALSAIVRDETAFVRTDPERRLEQTLAWELQIELPPRISRPARLEDGRITFKVEGYSAHAVVIQSSTNLIHWAMEATNSLTAGEFWHTNATLEAPQKWFRAVTSP